MARNVGAVAGSREWLSLGEASKTLGVTPNTLRRWADRGQFPSFTTPGGHRRFASSVVQSFLPSTRARRPALAAIGASSDRMVRAYRRARPMARIAGPPDWFDYLTEAQRSSFRRHGVELLTSLVQYLDSEPGDAVASLADAERLAREYGAAAAATGVTLSDTVEGFLNFRKPFVDELAIASRRRHLHTDEATGLLVQAQTALDRVLVALMLGHKTAWSGA